MKNYLLFLFLLGSLCSNAQVITTYAGNGSTGDTGDGNLATTAAIGYPDGCAFDSHGNFYFTQVTPDRVRKITPSGIISTIAGVGSSGYNGDGIPATDAQLYLPGSVIFDSLDNIFIGDAENNRVRKINAITGIITTIAGNSTFGFGGDGGPASAAVFNGVEDICFDIVGNLYIDDIGNYRIRKINTLGIITTILGNGIPGFTGDGGMATAATIEGVLGICTDRIGNLYLAQESDARVRKVDITTGIISTIAGNGSFGTAGDEGPATAAALDPIQLAFDGYQNLYISGYNNNDIRIVDNFGIIHTIAGNGIAGFYGDGESATSAELDKPFGVTFDTCGNLYISDKGNSRIRKVAFNPMCLDNLEVGNIQEESAINIYPNPAYALVNIDNIKGETNYTLLNIIGAVMQQGALQKGDNSISIQSLPPGMYMLELINDDKMRTLTKIIKQ